MSDSIGNWGQQELDNFIRQRLNLPGNLQQAIQVAVADATVPTGVVYFTAATAAPAGYLICDGSAVSRATYAALFSALGVAYGAGDGSTTFNLPDLRGRVPVGLGTNADCDVVGDNDGRAVASRSPRHTHNHAHTHAVNGGTTTVEGSFPTVVQSGTGVSVAPAGHTHNYSGSTSGGASVTATDGDYPAYTTLTPVIKV